VVIFRIRNCFLGYPTIRALSSCFRLIPPGKYTNYS
jgi:hypothetical protein